jgi:hypothetical protein
MKLVMSGCGGELQVEVRRRAIRNPHTNTKTGA